MVGESSYTGEYVPSFANFHWNKILMKEKSAKVIDFQGIKQLDLNPGGLMFTYISLDKDKLRLSVVRNI